MTVFLDGIAAQFYRGIGPEMQYIAPFSRMNFFIGANNAGKSIVLNLIASKLPKPIKRTSSSMIKGVADEYTGLKTGVFNFAVGRTHSNVRGLVAEENNGYYPNPPSDGLNLPLTIVDKLMELHGQAGCFWASEKENANFLNDKRAGIIPKVSATSHHNLHIKWRGQEQSIYSHIKMERHRARGEPNLKAVFEPVLPALPNIHLLPAKRQIGNKGEAFEDLSGRGLIDHLAMLQNPAFDKQADRERFHKINRFLQEVTGKVEASLEVPSEREHLLVHVDNKVLPLDALGTGIHEVILIAAFCTIHDGSIMCIEEPEIHLHPQLQRKLVNYLLENTTSQYFIATHSSVFIDTPGAHVFHVKNDGEQTRIRPALTKDDQRAVLDDLGYQASDILQANAVIWVEGPSDRIYLKHWIKAVDDRLKEGIHYSIMFYGGALISHLTASDDEVDRFIELRKLNSHMAIVLDSDRDAEGAPLKEHAQRLVTEMAKDGGIAWVTAGREVENYLDGGKLQSALSQIHSKTYVAPAPVSQFDHAFYFYAEALGVEALPKPYKKGDKVKLANMLCEEPANLDILDLRARIGELVAMVCRANDLTAIG